VAFRVGFVVRLIAAVTGLPVFALPIVLFALRVLADVVVFAAFAMAFCEVTLVVF
jgi:hypothetical protein